eukprot:TRINITY_DN6166_c0_g1_i1.p1 TRINITY_DN6166_c0_g1~~TRINITY_DN6166_c0_g1_i1.p1  ORF type:complete len:1811 (+),score=437.13 TRINITY_DN6166_c0_g1_i1:89-5521(+)
MKKDGSTSVRGLRGGARTRSSSTPATEGAQAVNGSGRRNTAAGRRASGASITKKATPSVPASLPEPESSSSSSPAPADPPLAPSPPLPARNSTGPAERSSGGAAVKAAATENLLQAAAAVDPDSIAKWLQKGGDPDAHGEDGRTPLGAVLCARVPDGSGKALATHAQRRRGALAALFRAGAHGRDVDAFMACMTSFVDAAAAAEQRLEKEISAGGGRGAAGPGGAAISLESKAADFQAQVMARQRVAGERVERKVNYVDPDVPPSALPPLLDWLLALPGVVPTLGYTTVHVLQLVRLAAKIVDRERRELALRTAARPKPSPARRASEGKKESPSPPIEDWMVALTLGAADGDAAALFDQYLAGILYTADLTEDVAGKQKTVWLTNPEVLANHGASAKQRLPLYYSMNAAMRNAPQHLPATRRGGDVFAAKGPLPQLHVIKTFQPLIRRLTELIQTLPSEPTTVFRGIASNVSASYRVGTSVVWNAFTSTSVDKSAARGFMGHGDGTFFTIIARDGAARVDFCSPYKAEQELLYAGNIEFRVMWKLSPTLLRMMGIAYDIVVMQEVGEGGTVVPEVRLFKDVLGQAMHFAQRFLETYVEGRVGDDAHVPEGDAEKLSTWIGEWLYPRVNNLGLDGNEEEQKQMLLAQQVLGRGPLSFRSKDKSAATDASPPSKEWRRPAGRPARCLIGVGGSGKTSASVAAMSWLLDPPAAWRLQQGEDAWERLFPIFLPLPSLGARLLQPGGIDAAICEMFSLDADGLSALGKEYDVVIVADSFDETGVTAPALRAAIATSGMDVRSLLGMNVWARDRSVIVTVRDEYLRANAMTAEDLCGGYVQCGHVQAFTALDASNYMKSVLLRQRKEALAQCGDQELYKAAAVPVADVAAGLQQALPWAMENPFVLSMLMEDHKSVMALHAARVGGAQEIDVYHCYLQSVAAAAVTKASDKKVHKADLTKAVDEVLDFGGSLAAHMVTHNLWQVSLSTAVDSLTSRKALPVKCRDALRALPLRVEDWGDDASALSFRHKTLGEYLVARRLWRDAAALKRDLHQRSFSKETPNVARFFSEMAAANPDEFMKRLVPSYMTLIAEEASSRNKGAWSDAAANALALLARCRVTLRGLVAPGLNVRRADLRHLVLSQGDLSGAVFEDCWLEGAELHTVDTTGTQYPLCNTTGSLVPLLIHNAEVTHVSTSACGDWIVSCVDGDAAAHVWAVATGGHLCALFAHRATALAAAFSRTGRIATAGADKFVLLHDVDMRNGGQWKAPVKLKGHEKAVNHVVFTRDGLRVVSGSSDTTVRMWSAAEGDLLLTLEGHTALVYCVGVSGNGCRIVSSSGDRSVRVWDIDAEYSDDGSDDGAALPAFRVTRTEVLKGHSTAVRSVAISEDGGRVVSGSRDTTVRIWDAATGAEQLVLNGHESFVEDVIVTADGSRAASCDRDGFVRVWDTATGKVLQTLAWHQGGVGCIAFTHDELRIASGSDDKTIRVCDVASGKEPQKLEGHTGEVWGVSVSPDGRTVASCSDDFTLRLWDTTSGAELRKFVGHTDEVRGVALRNAQVVSGSLDKTLRVWDVATGKQLRKLRDGHDDYITKVKLIDDGATLVSASEDGSVITWRAATGTRERVFCADADCAINAVAASPDGAWIASGGLAGVVYLWDAKCERARSTKPHATLKGHKGGFSVYALAFFPDGARIASASGDSTVRIWDVESARELKVLRGHDQVVNCLAVAHDGTWVASGGNDASIKIWDPVSGENLQNLLAHAGSVYSLDAAAGDDAQRLVSSSADRTVRVWNRVDGKFVLYALCGTLPEAAPRFVDS